MSGISESERHARIKALAHARVRSALATAAIVAENTGIIGPLVAYDDGDPDGVLPVGIVSENRVYPASLDEAIKHLREACMRDGWFEICAADAGRLADMIEEALKR